MDALSCSFCRKMVNFKSTVVTGLCNHLFCSNCYDAFYTALTVNKKARLCPKCQCSCPKKSVRDIDIEPAYVALAQIQTLINDTHWVPIATALGPNWVFLVTHLECKVRLPPPYTTLPPTLSEEELQHTQNIKSTLNYVWAVLHELSLVPPTPYDPSNRPLSARHSTRESSKTDRFSPSSKRTPSPAKNTMLSRPSVAKRRLPLRFLHLHPPFLPELTPLLHRRPKNLLPPLFPAQKIHKTSLIIVLQSLRPLVLSPP